MIRGGDGVNTIAAGDGRNDIIVGSHDDLVTTGSGDDRINAGNGANTVNAGAGDNSITTGDGNDAVTAGSGADAITTGGGDDTIAAGLGNDVIDGGGAIDTVILDGGGDLTVDLAQIGGQETGQGFKTFVGIENLIGGAGNDRLSGSDDGNALSGGIGNDTLVGAGGDDGLNGGEGRDAAVFFGARADYVVTINGDGSVTVTDSVADRNGTDVLNDIEVLQFSDGDLSLTNTAPDAPVAGMLVDLHENQSGQAVVASVHAADDGEGGAVAYTLIQNPGGLFTIDPDSGAVIFLGNSIDYETNASLEVENPNTAQERKFFRVLVRAVESGPGGLSSNDTAIKIYLEDANEAPVKAIYAVAAVSENAASGDSVGTVQSVIDPDTAEANRSFKFTQIDANGAAIARPSRFTVDADTGEIKVGALGLPNVSAATDFQVHVKVTDRGGLGSSHVETVTVRVNNVGTGNQNPSVPTLVHSGVGSPGSGAEAGTILVAETANLNDEIGTLAATDGDGDQLSFALTAGQDGGGLFKVVGSKILIANKNLLPVDADTNYTIGVDVSDGNGGSSHQAFTIRVKNVAAQQNAAPTDIALSTTTAPELAAAGTVVGTLRATDSNAGETFTYSLLNGDGRFAIAGDKLVVANGFRLDYEQAVAHQVAVRVTDQAGASFDKVFSVGVLDLTPEFTAGSLDNDLFKGGAGRDVLFGNFGNDTIYGGANNDQLRGDAGNDYLFGGAGKDVLYGGLNKDVFAFDAKVDKKNWKLNVDKIMDYKVKDDTIALDNAVFKKLGVKGTLTKPAKLNKAFFTVGTAAKDKNDYLIYDNKKKVLYYDDDGSGAHAAYQIATFDKKLKLTMTAAEFLVI